MWIISHHLLCYETTISREKTGLFFYHAFIIFFIHFEDKKLRIKPFPSWYICRVYEASVRDNSSGEAKAFNLPLKTDFKFMARHHQWQDCDYKLKLEKTDFSITKHYYILLSSITDGI